MNHPFLTFEVGENGILPTRGTLDAAGLDLYAASGGYVLPGHRITVDLDIKSSFARGWVALIRDRSGLAAKNGIHVLAGVIDSDYRGEWLVVLLNTSKEGWHFSQGARVAQVVLTPCYVGTPAENFVYDGTTQRGAGGFGSTGS